MKDIRVFLFENFLFLQVKFSTYLNRHVFVMPILTILTPSYEMISANVLQAPVKLTVNALAASCQYCTVKSKGFF